MANKCDTPELDAQAAEFYKFGQGEVLCVSAQQNRGARNCSARSPRCCRRREADETTPKEPAMKLAIVGRRNTGKSTFINCLAQSERMIVSEVPGTTRDSVDVRFERDGKTFIAIDTAGVRKQDSIANDVEFYSMARAERSIRRADVVLLFFDAASQDQQGRQAAGRLHSRAAQAGDLRRQQVGPDEADADRQVWRLPAQDVSRASITCRSRSSRRRRQERAIRC